MAHSMGLFYAKIQIKFVKYKKILDKVIQLMYNILKGMTLPIGRKCMTGVSAMGLGGRVKAYA